MEKLKWVILEPGQKKKKGVNQFNHIHLLPFYTVVTHFPRILMTNTKHNCDPNKIQGPTQSVCEQSHIQNHTIQGPRIIKRELLTFTCISQSTLKVNQFITHHNKSQKHFLSALTGANWETLQAPAPDKAYRPFLSSPLTHSLPVLTDLIPLSPLPISNTYLSQSFHIAKAPGQGLVEIFLYRGITWGGG